MSQILLKNVILDYPVYGSSPRVFARRLLSLASAGTIKSNDKYDVIRGLNGIDLELNPGDRLGIVGGNGAGKTTLLKTISGIYHPTQGICKTKGKVTSLISFGFGMEEDATGFQNIILGGIVLGYTKKQMQEKFSEIEEFTELGDFLHMPIRTYSAGMKLRLAFGIATSVEPEILVIDEGIGAGDSSFYKKATTRIESFLNKASILVLASHSDDLISQFCNKAIYMAKGKIEKAGSVSSILKYKKEKSSK